MKVFGIGLNKTGTTTLAVCLRKLGYSVAKGDHLYLLRHAVKGEMDPVYDVVDKHDGFEDWPWPLVYKELDQRYPGSKFILTKRTDAETWFKSLEKHAGRTGPTEQRKLAYGYEMPHEHKEQHLEFYESHNAQVAQYFEGRDGDLLEVCWETGSDWEALCAFLGHEIPDIPFPHANRRPTYSRKLKKAQRGFVSKLKDGAKFLRDGD